MVSFSLIAFEPRNWVQILSVCSAKQKTDTFEYYMVEHLKMSAVYWACSAMDLMNCLHEMPKAEIVDWVLKCYHPKSTCLSRSNWVEWTY